MVGLSGGKDSWALLQILDVLRQRAPIGFSLVAVNVDSGYKDYKHDVIARTCEERGWEYRIEHTDDRRGDGRHARGRRDAVLAVRAPAPRRALPHRERGRRHEDRARPSPRRLHRDAAAEPVLRRRAQGDAGAAGLGQRRARRHPAAGLRRRGRGARLRQGVRAADHRLLLPGVRRPQPAAAAHQAADHGPRDASIPASSSRCSRRSRNVDAAPPARHAAQPAGELRTRRLRRDEAIARAASSPPSEARAGRIACTHQLHGVLAHAAPVAASVRAVVQRVSSASRRRRSATRRRRDRRGCWCCSASAATTARPTCLHSRRRSASCASSRTTAASRWTVGARQPAAACSWCRSSRCTATCRKGRRPSFDAAAPPEQVARALYEDVVSELRVAGVAVAAPASFRR